VGRRRQVVTALFVLPVLLVLYGLAPTLGLSALALLVVGGCYIGVLSGLNTVVQLRAPTEARGRVLSLFMLALGTMYPVGAVVEGAIGHVIGVRTVTIGAAVALLVVLGLLGVTRRAMFDALGDVLVTPPAPSAKRAPPATEAEPGPPAGPAPTGAPGGAYP
jgi:MFS family permease